MKVVHEWLKEYVGPSIPSPEKLEELFMFHAFEVEGLEKVGMHDVIDVKVLPDRASYCLSHRGIAREIASITGTPLAYDPLQSNDRLPIFDQITVDIEDAHACTRFGAALITGITVGPSPEWLQNRLLALGQRPINNIVDATNYVMYAVGQPLHAYDARKFPQKDGVWQFHVRFADKGETVSLIAESGKTEDRIVTLDGTELLIVDKSSNRAIGLAGVKGGAFAGVDAQTKNIIIEAAHFDPVITRKTARRLGIVIDASKRFENNPSQNLIPHALREIVGLIQDIAGGACEGSIDRILQDEIRPVVTVDPMHVNALLGLSLSREEISALLLRIGASITEEGNLLQVQGPWERSDLTIEEDFIEEVGRLYGYEHVVSVIPSAVSLSEINARHYYSECVRSFLITEGFSEVITSSFRNKDEIQLQNALASDKSYVRSSLRKNIEEVLRKNAPLADLLGATSTRIFEIGTVFNKGKEGIEEHVSLCLGTRIKAQGYTSKDDAAITEVITALSAHMGRALSFDVEQGIAECDFSAVASMLPVPDAYEPVTVSEEVQFQAFSTFPFISRDIALWVTEGILPESVESVINGHAGVLRVRTTLVDVFAKERRTSYAFRLVFQASDRTLTDEEINTVMDAVYKAAGSEGWEVR